MLKRYTAREIHLEIVSIEGSIKDYENSLKKLRGENWEDGIGRDERISIQCMYKELVSLRQKLKMYLDVNFIQWEDVKTIENELRDSKSRTELAGGCY